MINARHAPCARMSDVNTCPVLVGRQTELTLLTDALTAGGVFLVSGEAGIGKSRLLRELADAASNRDVTVLWGRPEILSDPGPLSTIADLLEEAGQVEELRLEASEILMNIEEAEPPPRQVAARIRGALSNSGTPVALLLEDLHDADELSLAVIGHLARAAKDDGVLLVGTFRPATTPALDRVLDVLSRDRLAVELPLQPLDDGDVKDMLRAMWGREPADEELAETVRLAEGMPFFAEELAASRGSVIPESITRAVAARLSALSPDGRRLIEVASLVAGAVDPGLLSVVARVEEGTVASHLVSAVRAGLLVDREGRLVFRHGLMRDAVSQGLVSVDRVRIHRELAIEIERRGAEHPEHIAGALARHLQAAGDMDGAAKWAIIAGRRSLHVAALDEAAAHFNFGRDNARDKAMQVSAREGLCEIASRVDPRDECEWEALALEFEALSDPVAAARCWSKLSWTERWRQNHRQAVVLLERARRGLDPESHAAELSRVAIEKGLALLAGSDEEDEAEPSLERGLTLARSAGRLDLVSEALSGLSHHALQRGSLERGLEHVRLSREAALASQDGKTIAHVFGQQAWILLYAGRADEALASLDEAEAWSRSHVGGGVVAAVEAARALINCAVGRPGPAASAAARLGATAHVNDMGSYARLYALLEQEGTGAARASLGAWWDVMGGSDHRQRWLEHPSELLEQSPEFLLICIGELITAEVSATDSIEWWESVLRAFRAYYSTADAAGRMDILIASSAAARRIGSLGEMRSILSSMDETLVDAPFPPFQSAAQYLRAEVAWRTGDTASVETAWRAVDMLWGIRHIVDAAWAACLALRADDGVPAPARQALLREIAEGAAKAGATRALADLEGHLRRAGIRIRSGRPRGRPALDPGTLSAREEEVAVLVAAGASNGEIARRLVLSERTVEDHIARAQKRLSVTGRAGLAAWAAKRGLV